MESAEGELEILQKKVMNTMNKLHSGVFMRKSHLKGYLKFVKWVSSKESHRGTTQKNMGRR